MKNNRAVRWIFVLVIILLLNTLCMPSDVNAKAKTKGSKKSSFSSIQKGDSGNSVVEIQKQLLALGYLTFSVDGEFGPGTEQAVKDFQSVHHLKSTGIVNKETYDAIKNGVKEFK